MPQPKRRCRRAPGAPSSRRPRVGARRAAQARALAAQRRRHLPAHPRRHPGAPAAARHQAGRGAPGRGVRRQPHPGPAGARAAAHDRIVTVIANRGAFVSSPTVEEAREVFEARRLIEPDLVRQRRAQGATPPTSARCASTSRSNRRRAQRQRQARDHPAVGRLPSDHRRHGGQLVPRAHHARARIADLPRDHPVRRAGRARRARTTSTAASSTRSRRATPSAPPR